MEAVVIVCLKFETFIRRVMNVNRKAELLIDVWKANKFHRN